jgi:hypothetical protein
MGDLAYHRKKIAALKKKRKCRRGAFFSFCMPESPEKTFVG